MVERPLHQSPADEAELVEHARRHSPAAIRLILQQQNRRLYRIARSIVRDDSEAEDVLQEAYVRAFTRLSTFRGDARFSTWLARIVINEALGRLRHRRPTLELSAVMARMTGAQIIPFPHVSMPPDPEALMAQQEIRALLEQAIDRLPDAFRTVLVARLVEGLSTEETAELLGIRPETVKTRLHRARRLLKRDLEEQIGPVLAGAFPFAGCRCRCLTEAVLERLGLA
ncbi:RNA polymerase sigma factor [Methylobacterium nodulans]|uniref:RNA polymerase sigma factor n=1 Tax=Methylobacterium nodulans (strain LMG 21967 / CNCM I-2342 / ORS 2060) TaxID=460265 RepID=B8IFC0_METNO|nr:RNA polymerase sigma factor [Methylobacterium nodulans]ACL57655.1 RNA polymerase, sigma-24 subunit, ECF subfamily [Methylobacterium nodulans ORS 2060]